LTEAGLPFSMLNAKQHEREAAIIAKAGEPGAITLATSMAGRGTDIVLGGSIHDELEALDPNAPEDLRANIQAQWQLRHDEVVALGGLHVLGTERQESRRIDNQLRGRAGRQGDPGSSRFYLSLEDDLLRIFASGWIKNLLGAMGMREGAILENAHLSRQVERAQRQMEARNFDARKNLLDYDRVVQEQRRHIYGQRQQLLESPLEELEAKDNAWQILWASYPAFASQSDVLAWGERWSLVVDPASFVDDDPDQHEKIWRQACEQGWARLGPWETQADRLRKALVDSLDRNWRLHLDRLELLRQGIHLRGFAQKQPLQEYRRDAHGLFQTMVGDIRTEAVAEWMKVPVLAVENLTPPASRNAPCPCGSGLRYKHCHGQLT
jgi:preprotein translocase subunit SecA